MPVKRHVVMVCAGCRDCEPLDGSEPLQAPCRNSSSMDGRVVVLAEDYDRRDAYWQAQVEALTADLRAERDRAVETRENANAVSVRVEGENKRLREAVVEARYYVARCNQIEGTDESRRWLLNNPGMQPETPPAVDELQAPEGNR